jgi:hypothetical protein
MEQSKRKLITIDDKDKLLDCLIENCQVGEVFYCKNIDALEEISGLEAKNLHALFVQIDQQNLIKYGDPIHYIHKTARFILHQNAVDFKMRGGFKMAEEIFDTRISKLFEEIENLKRSNPLADLSNITTIASGLLSAANEIFKK